MANYKQGNSSNREPNKTWVEGNEIEIEERVVKMSRVTKVVKGGRRFSFNALTVVGDSNSYVGIGFGKAQEVPEAIRKSIENAKVKMIRVKKQGTTIPHEVIGKYKSAKVLLKPSSLGTGIIAGAAVRAVVELGGIQDILTKRYGSSNSLNIVKATLNALEQIITPDEAKKMRNVTLPQIFGKYSKKRREEKIQQRLDTKSTKSDITSEEDSNANIDNEKKVEI